LKVGAAEFYDAWKRGEAIILDVRSREEAGLVSIGPALHVPLNELPDRVEEIPKDKTIVIFCPGKLRAGIAYAYLRVKGFEKVKVLNGGLDDIANLERP
jgi:rhodanese-related sulfurtransferase